MLSILEYSDVGSTQRGSLNVPLEPPVAIQSIEVTPTSTQSAPMAASTAIVKVSSTVDAVIDVGIDPNATDSLRRLKAGDEQTLTVTPAKAMRIAVMASGTPTTSKMDSLEGLLALVTKPAEVKSTLDALSQATAKADAAAAEHKAAAEATGWAGKLSEWDANLKQREQELAAGQAELESKLARLRALA
jgi:predicted Zn-dependent protease